MEKERDISSVHYKQGRLGNVCGPPTSNGLPHAGHALGRTIKDFVVRYKTMSGYRFIRKAGWDTH